MELKRVLLIEDNPDVRQSIVREFGSEGIEIIEITDYDDLEKHFTSLLPFQMVVLDWLLDGENDNDALLCLNKLRGTCFVPVVIWTEELEIYTYPHCQDHKIGKISDIDGDYYLPK